MAPCKHTELKVVAPMHAYCIQSKRIWLPCKHTELKDLAPICKHTELKDSAPMQAYRAEGCGSELFSVDPVDCIYNREITLYIQSQYIAPMQKCQFCASCMGCRANFLAPINAYRVSSWLVLDPCMHTGLGFSSHA